MEVDLAGPSASQSRRIALLHDMCMKSRKQCYQLFAGQEPKSSAAWRIPAYPSSSPHYLDTTRKGKARPHSQDHWNAVFHSTSVLGRLFDYAQFTVMAVETQHAGTASVSAGSSVDEPAVKLDPDDPEREPPIEP